MKSQECVENYRITFLCLFENSSTPPRLSSSSLPNTNGKPVVTKKSSFEGKYVVNFSHGQVT